MKPDRITWRDEPITDGWEGFLNAFRSLFGRPLMARRVYTAVFDELVIPPGETVLLELPSYDDLLEETL